MHRAIINKEEILKVIKYIDDELESRFIQKYVSIPRCDHIANVIVDGNIIRWEYLYPESSSANFFKWYKGLINIFITNEQLRDLKEELLYLINYNNQISQKRLF